MGDYGFAPPTQRRVNPEPEDLDDEDFQATIWAEGLDEQHIAAIHDYTANAFDDINAALKRGTHDDLAEHHKRTMAGLDEALASAWEHSRTVYRGVRVPRAWDGPTTEARIEEAFPVGTSVAFPQYLSTSLRPSVATGFSRGTKLVVFEMHTKQGAYVEPLSQMPGECEVIIGRDTQWRVAGVTTNGQSVKSTFDGVEPEEVIIVHLVDEQLVDEESAGPAPGLPPVRELEAALGG